MELSEYAVLPNLETIWEKARPQSEAISEFQAPCRWAAGPNIELALSLYHGAIQNALAITTQGLSRTGTAFFGRIVLECQL